MSSSAVLTRGRRIQLDGALALSGVLALSMVLALTVLLADHAGEWLTKNTIRLAMFWYAAALLLMLRLQPNDWDASTLRGRTTRWCWTWGMICFLFHMAMAFHYYHHWSHADAFQRTKEISGVGQGIYASYTFAVLWIVDVGIWWLSPRRYATRAAWLDRMLHALMLFIVFNAMVVYETGTIRWAGLTMFSILAFGWIVFRGLPRFRAT